MKKNRLPETLVLSIDFDACTDTKLARNKLLVRIVNFISENPLYTKVMVFIGSARQSLWYDFVNAAKEERDEPYQSCCILGINFVDALRGHLGKNITVLFDPILTYDVYHQLPLGTTFLWMKKVDYEAYHVQEKKAYLKANNHSGTSVDMFRWTGSRFDLSENKIEEVGAFDTFKRDLCYMQMQQAAKKLGSSANFSFILVDDRGDILKGVQQFFSQHAGLIPETCSIQYMQHISYEPLFHSKYIPFSDTSWTHGCGAVNLKFESDMRRIRALALQDITLYEKTYATDLSQLSATYKVESAFHVDVAPVAPNKQSSTYFAMQMMQYVGAPVGLLAALGLLVFGRDKQQRVLGGVTGVLVTSVWLSNCFFSESTDAQAKTDSSHTKNL